MVKIISFGNIRGIESRIAEIERKISDSTPTTEFSKYLGDVAENGKKDIDNIIEEISSKYGIDKNLVTSIANAESNKNPKAVSNKGAMGIMQLMPETAKDLGVKNPFDIRENVEAGVLYFKDMLNKYKGDTEKALAAYNAGPGTVDKYGGIPPYKETQNYIRKIMKQYTELKGGE